MVQLRSTSALSLEPLWASSSKERKQRERCGHRDPRHGDVNGQLAIENLRTTPGSIPQAIRP